LRVCLYLLVWLTSVTQVCAYPALVISVHDGDTIRVRRNNSAVERIRLANIDAPELKQPEGLAARSLTEQLTLGRTVQVRAKGHDRYGRTIASAWWYEAFDPDDALLANLQKRARQKRLGIWSARNQTAPWDYRRASNSVFAPASERVLTRYEQPSNRGHSSDTIGSSLKTLRSQEL
jgi:endonuclease YncB( thermonuclease family)